MILLYYWNQPQASKRKGVKNAMARLPTWKLEVISYAWLKKIKAWREIMHNAAHCLVAGAVLQRGMAYHAVQLCH
jgi:hypothetical protein